MDGITLALSAGAGMLLFALGVTLMVNGIDRAPRSLLRTHFGASDAWLGMAIAILGFAVIALNFIRRLA